MKTLLRVALFASLLSTTALAHHGNAAFDVGKMLELKGNVTEWIWANPHCFLKFDVTDPNGTTRHWMAETTSPSRMQAIGWRKNSLKTGDRVTIDVVAVKDGRPAGRIVRVRLPDGQVLTAQ